MNQGSLDLKQEPLYTEAQVSVSCECPELDWDYHTLSQNELADHIFTNHMEVFYKVFFLCPKCFYRISKSTLSCSKC